MGFVALIFLGFRQEHAGKEQKVEGIGRTGVIWKENTELLISAVFQAVVSISHSMRTAKDKYTALSVPRPGDTSASFVFPILEKYKGRRNPPHTNQHPFLFTYKAVDNKIELA